MTASTARKAEQAHHLVRIHVHEEKFVYTGLDGGDAAVIKVRAGDTVTWRCDHGNYSVLFKQKSPFHVIAVHGVRGFETIAATVEGTPGSYTYAVTVAHDDGLRTDDPEVIIGND